MNRLLLHPQNAKVAQLVERDLAKVEVASSNLVFRSKPFRSVGKAFLLGLSTFRKFVLRFEVQLPGW